MRTEKYQAQSFRAEKDLYAVLDLKISQVITAAILLFIVPSSFLAYLFGNFGSSLIFFGLVLYFFKKSAKTFLVYKNKDQQLDIYIIDGLMLRKKTISVEEIEKFTIDHIEHKYRIAIILKNGKAIVPVPFYTEKIFLHSLHKTIELFSQVLSLEAPSIELNNQQELVKEAKKKEHQYVQAKHWQKQVNLKAIKYLKRPSLPAVTRISQSNKNFIIVFIVIICLCLTLYFI